MEKRWIKYGFFGGSFNPVTNAHIYIALDIIKKYKLDKVIFVPVGNKYNKIGLIDEKHRYNMLKIATKQYDKLEVSNIELNSDRNFKAIEVFEIINQKYIDTDIYFIIGADNLYKMPMWKNLEKLVTYKYIVIKRNTLDCNELINSNEILKKHKDKFNIIENNEHNMDSATKVRVKLSNKDLTNLDKYINKEVVSYITENNLYK